MATLIYESTLGGKRRRCDARCYNAKGVSCKCICNGMNHGRGLKQALENTQKMATELLKQVEKTEEGKGAN